MNIKKIIKTNEKYVMLEPIETGDWGLAHGNIGKIYNRGENTDFVKDAKHVIYKDPMVRFEKNEDDGDLIVVHVDNIIATIEI